MSAASQIIEQAKAQSVPELIAVVTAIAYLVFAIRQNIVCWLFAAISTSIYVALFIDARLYMESLLNVFYLAMAIYGWQVWKSGGDQGGVAEVVIWPLRIHAIAIAALLFISAINGYLLARFTDAVFPYIDSLTTWFAFWATFLVARKVLENWYYWIMIDITSMIIYWSRDLHLTSALFAVYVLMIPFGLVSWTRSMQQRARA